MRRHIIVGMFCTILLILSAYCLFAKVLKKNEKINMNTNNESIKEYTKEDFDKIVMDWLGLEALLNKKSLNELTNQEKLRMLINLYTDADKYETFSEAKLDVIHSGSVIKDLKVKYEDLYDGFGTFIWSTKNIAYKYDASKRTFTYTGVSGHGMVAKGNIIYNKMLSLDTDGMTYTVKYIYVFYNASGEGPSDITLYLNVNDALNEKNKLVTLEYDYETDSCHEEEYIEKHYDEIKEKLQVYTYVFKVENDHLVITDFSVK